MGRNHQDSLPQKPKPARNPRQRPTSCDPSPISSATNIHPVAETTPPVRASSLWDYFTIKIRNYWKGGRAQRRSAPAAVLPREKVAKTAKEALKVGVATGEVVQKATVDFAVKEAPKKDPEPPKMKQETDIIMNISSGPVSEDAADENLNPVLQMKKRAPQPLTVAKARTLKIDKFFNSKKTIDNVLPSSKNKKNTMTSPKNKKSSRTNTNNTNNNGNGKGNSNGSGNGLAKP